MHIIERAYRNYQKRLYSYSFTLTKNEQQAKDLMQDALLSCLTASNLPTCEEKAFHYLFTVIRNKFLTSKKKEENSSEARVRYSNDVDAEMYLDRQRAYDELSNLSQSEELEAHEKYLKVRKFIEARFPIITARAFIQKYLTEEPKTISQIAEDIGEPKHKVRYRLKQCMDALRNFTIS